MYMRLSLITVIREEGMGTSGMRSARPALHVSTLLFAALRTRSCAIGAEALS
jgi:hypothetical protein